MKNIKQIFKPLLTSSRALPFFILHSSFFIFFACDVTMEKELDIKTFDFPPKLSVTAILDGGSDVFDIRLVEGISLAEHNKVYNNLLHVYYESGEPPKEDIMAPNTVLYGSENIRNGEIRLYEDGELILSIPGPFNMSRLIIEETKAIGGKLVTFPGFGDGWKWGKNGYRRIINGINTRRESVYRLEADIDGYPLASAASVMPAAPIVSANMDVAVQVVKKKVREIETVLFDFNALGGFNHGKYPDLYWSLSVHIDAPDINNYLALDVITEEYQDNALVKYSWGIGASDVSILLEDGISSEMIGGESADLYLFPILVTKNFATCNFFVATTNQPLTLRVRNITPATYRFYQSLSMQYKDDFFTAQPTAVVGNIEGGYGNFAVYNSIDVALW